MFASKPEHDRLQGSSGTLSVYDMRGSKSLRQVEYQHEQWQTRCLFRDVGIIINHYYKDSY